MEKNTRTKVLAVAVVMIMALSVIPIMGLDEGMDAAVPEGAPYSYTMVYDSSVMETGTNSLSVDGMTAIYHPSYDSTSVTDEDDGTDGYGSWTWDLETGLGPFNSFYAAFDIDNNNALVAILNPFDLSKSIQGKDLPDGRFNIMWVLPTVYWMIGETDDATPLPTLTLTNNPDAGGTAYAHTINGHVYKYVAYGVYEGYNDTITVDGESKTILTSQTGKTPTYSVSRPNFRNYASNVEMDASLSLSEENPAYCLIWNFYQWELYKYCALTMMEDFNAQSTVGNGKVYTSDNSVRYNTTGLTDLMGPYAGTIGDVTQSANDADSVKLFIENAWGSLADFVDGVVFNYTEVYSSQVPDSQTTVDIYIQTIDKPTDTTDATLDYVDKIELSSRYQPDNDSKGGSETKIKETKVGEGAKVGEDAEDPSLISSGYPLDIITNDARMWGFGDVAGGSATTGVSDYEWLPSGTGAKLFAIGGPSTSSSSDWPRFGLSAAYSNFGLSSAYADLGARSAFVFDAAVLPADLTISADPAEYGTLSSGEETDLSSFDIDYVPLGSTFTVNGNSLTVDGTTVTAVPEDPETDYAYVFDGWYDGTKKITSSTVVTGDMQITAKFLRSPIITVTFDGNGGTPSFDTKEVISGQPYGDLPSVDLEGKYFKGWYTAGGLKVTSDSIVASTTDTTLYAQYSMESYGTLLDLIDMLPLLFVIAIIFGLLAAAMYYRTG